MIISLLVMIGRCGNYTSARWLLGLIPSYHPRANFKAHRPQGSQAQGHNFHNSASASPCFVVARRALHWAEKPPGAPAAPAPSAAWEVEEEEVGPLMSSSRRRASSLSVGLAIGWEAEEKDCIGG